MSKYLGGGKEVKINIFIDNLLTTSSHPNKVSILKLLIKIMQSKQLQ